MIAFAFATLIAPCAPSDRPKDVEEYVAKLTAAAPTADAQFKLGGWAKQRGMSDVAEGHWRTAVHLDPAFAPAQKALGRALHDGVWEAKEERRARKAKEESLQRKRAEWLRTLKEVGVEAAVQGQPLCDAGVSAIEEFASSDARRALAAVHVFKESNLGTTTLALQRQAVASPFADVRLEAAKALAERNPGHYLVALLEHLKPRREGKSIVLGVGEVWYWQEGATMFVAAPIPGAANVGSSSGAVTKSDLEQRMAERQANADVVRANAVAALQTVTGKDIGDDFGEWRKEVMQLGEVFVDGRRAGATSMAATYYQPDVTVTGTYFRPNLTSRVVTLAMSCFAAGTPVVTKRGEVPIDKVCLGELVLSKNVETGDTAYKPVLTRTLRPRIPMQKLAIGGETFLATAGHPFWDSAKGWVKAKNLAKNASLGTETGVVSMSANDAAAEPMQAYNLVVADFGTYFVGKSRLLVHDNTPIRESK